MDPPIFCENQPVQRRRIIVVRDLRDADVELRSDVFYDRILRIVRLVVKVPRQIAADVVVDLDFSAEFQIRIPAQMDPARKTRTRRNVAVYRSARESDIDVRMIIRIQHPCAAVRTRDLIAVYRTARHFKRRVVVHIQRSAAVVVLILVAVYPAVFQLHFSRLDMNPARTVTRTVKAASDIASRRRSRIPYDQLAAVYVDYVPPADRRSTVSVNIVSVQVENDAYSRRHVQRAVHVTSRNRSEPARRVLRRRPSRIQFHRLRSSAVRFARPDRILPVGVCVIADQPRFFLSRRIVREYEEVRIFRCKVGLRRFIGVIGFESVCERAVAQPRNPEFLSVRKRRARKLRNYVDRFCRRVMQIDIPRSSGNRIVVVYLSVAAKIQLSVSVDRNPAVITAVVVDSSAEYRQFAAARYRNPAAVSRTAVTVPSVDESAGIRQYAGVVRRTVRDRQFSVDTRNPAVIPRRTARQSAIDRESL